MGWLRAARVELASALIAFCVYLATMPPSLTWSRFGIDGGDLARAIARGALPHPPGFPAYLLIGNLFLRLPLEPAFSLNLMSAFFTASAVALIVATARRMNGARFAAMSAGLALAFAPLVWAHAIIVEVYALALFGAAFLLWLAARDVSPTVRAFALGIATGAHPVLIFYAPIIWTRRASEPPRKRSTSTPSVQPPTSNLQLPTSNLQSPISILSISNPLISFSLGWFFIYGFILLALNRASSPWGEISSLERWWSFVSAELYRGYLFATPLADLPARAIALIETLLVQFTPLGALIAIFGCAQTWRAHRAFAFASLIPFLLIAIFAITYNTFDSFVYLALALPILALYLASGLSLLTSHVSRITHVSRALRITLYVLLPLFQLALFWNAINLRDDDAAMQWARQTLRDAPPRAILLTNDDAQTFALWYARDALGERADVIVLDRDLWLVASYRKMLTDQFALADDLDAATVAQKSKRPVIVVEKR
ncbi:MAG: DUF2723 domain-containing protein [Chloroflexi bacterium]|nr:DUF2723 domain-containing protein [Chloroflexota bacterium]